MKTVKLSLMAVALVAGIAGAFATSQKVTVRLDDPTAIYNFDSNQSGYSDQLSIDVPTARAYYDCPEGIATVCAFGTKVSGPSGDPLNFELRKP